MFDKHAILFKDSAGSRFCALRFEGKGDAWSIVPSLYAFTVDSEIATNTRRIISKNMCQSVIEDKSAY